MGGWSLTLFNVKGIDVKIHITFLLVWLWAAWFWSGEVDSAVRGVIFGVVAVTLLFVCVTLHEFGHAFQARAYGIQTEDITLLPIGGVARLTEIPDDPHKEFRIAIAGPMVNVVIAAILAVISVIVVPGGLSGIGNIVNDMQEGTWRALIGYLLVANTWLVLFNLIPAFPMDGGRILRSLLAMRMDYQRATAIAVRVAQVIAIGMAVFALYAGQFFLLFIAIFVWFGGTQEIRQREVRSVLGQVRVGDAMSRRPITLSPDMPLDQAVMATIGSAQAEYPVVDGNGYVIGLTNLQQLIAAHQQQEKTVRSAVTRGYSTVTPEDTLATAQQQLVQSGISVVPVVTTGGMLVGLLSINDLIAADQRAHSKDQAKPGRRRRRPFS